MSHVNTPQHLRGLDLEARLIVVQQVLDNALSELQGKKKQLSREVAERVLPALSMARAAVEDSARLLATAQTAVTESAAQLEVAQRESDAAGAEASAAGVHSNHAGGAK